MKTGRSMRELPIRIVGERLFLPPEVRGVTDTEWGGELICFAWNGKLVLVGHLRGDPLLSALDAVLPEAVSTFGDRSPLEWPTSLRQTVRAVASRILTPSLEPDGSIVVPPEDLEAVGLLNESASIKRVGRHFEIEAGSHPTAETP